MRDNNGYPLTSSINTCAHCGKVYQGTEYISVKTGAPVTLCSYQCYMKHIGFKLDENMGDESYAHKV